MCMSGCNYEGNVNHLFFECPFFNQVWLMIFYWFDISGALPNTVLDQAIQFVGLVCCGRVKWNKIYCVCLTVI